MNENFEILYDDDEAIKFIKNYLPENMREKFSDDDIEYIIDLIYEYYSEQGLLDDDESDDDIDVEIDEDEMVAYVIKQAKSDGVGKFEADEIAFVVRGELEYCESIGMFE